MRKTSLYLLLIVTFSLLAATQSGCTEAQESTKIETPIYVGSVRTLDNQPLTTFKTDLGYDIELKKFAVKLHTIQFATGGEDSHATLEPVAKDTLFAKTWNYLSDSLIANAYAHPGHAAVGDISGELHGTLTYDWIADAKTKEIGKAQILEGKYRAATIEFIKLNDGSPSIHIEGVAKKDGVEHTFMFEVASYKKIEHVQLLGDDNAKIIEENKATKISLDFLPKSTLSNHKSFLDEVDFAKIEADKGAESDGEFKIKLVTPKDSDPESYKKGYQLIKTNLTETHDYYAMTFENK